MRAAEERIEDGNRLMEQNRSLAAIYLFGYGVEMILAASYFRIAGFSPNMPIDRDTRQRHMANARRVTMDTDQPLMEPDPHPLVGWARLLKRRRSASPDLTARQVQLLEEAIKTAERVYRHWRPELRYKTVQVTDGQVEEVQRAATWFIRHREHLSGRD
jgi:hypothetical protein